jgi:hypothetical protein
MKNRIFAVMFTMAVISAIAWSAPTTDSYDRTGQWGIGLSPATTFPGIDVRHWFSDRVAFDVGAATSLDINNNDTNNQHQDQGYNAQIVWVVHKRVGLRIEGLLGINYDNNKTDTQSLTSVVDTNNTANTGTYTTTDNLVKTTTAGIGIAAEYSFQELPDLGFSAFATGFGAAWVTHSETSTQNFPNARPGPTTIVQTINESYVTLATRPSVGLAVHYYF